MSKLGTRKFHGAVIDVDQEKIQRFLQTGHPRTVGILLGKHPNPDNLFAGVSVENITINGAEIKS